MILDLKNNELVFSDYGEGKELKEILRSIPRIKFRDYRNTLYVSLAYLDDVLRLIGPKFKDDTKLSLRYRQFAQRFILDKSGIKIKWTPSLCFISGKGLPWREILPLTSYFDKGAKTSKQYGKSWSGQIHLFDVLTGTLPSGLLERLLSTLHKNNIPYEIERTFDYPEPYLSLNPVFSFTPTVDQVKCVEALDKSNNGIAKCPTGFGKTSYVAAALIAKKGVRSMFLANQRILTDDAMKDFKSIFKNDSVKLGMIGDGVFEPGDITVASIQSIASALKPPSPKEVEIIETELALAQHRLTYASNDEQKKIATKDVKRCETKVKNAKKKLERHAQLIPFLKSVDLFIVDESQVLGTKQWNEFLHACPAPYRYTLSATDTRSDGGRIQIVAATGERRFESSAAEQIEKGRLSEFVGHFAIYDHRVDKKISRELKMDFHQAYETFIMYNEKRNRHLCEQVIKWAMDYSVLALVTRKEHGHIVKQMLMDMGMPEWTIGYVDGDTSKKDREEIIENFRNKKFPILIGTSIFDVGFNAKNAAKMVRFNAGASEVREPQRAGRTVRKREDGSIGETYDFIDKNCPIFESQSWKRYRKLKEEFGDERVKINNVHIDGTLNVAGLKELVKQYPAETDRERGEEIIRQLQIATEDEFEVEIDMNDGDIDPELQSLFEELSENN